MGLNRRVAWILALIGVVPQIFADTGAGYQPRRLDGAQAGADVLLLRRALVEVHPGFGRYTSTDATLAMLDNLAERVAKGTTDAELYPEVSLVLARLRCDHTKAELPRAMASYRKENPSYLPFVFRIFAGRMYVAGAGSGVGLERGDEIVSINRRAVGDVLEKVSRYLSVDGWTDHAKIFELENAGGELMGSAIDHFWPLLYGWPQQWELEVRTLKDAGVKRVTADPILYQQWNELAAQAFPGAANFKDAVRFRILDEKTALLEVDTFVNYREPVDAVAMLQPAFQELRDKQIEHLILDLRKCGGGSDDAAAALGSFLFAEPPPPPKQAWVRTYRVGDLREHLSTWDQRVFEAPDEMFKKLDNGFYEFVASGSEPTRPNPLAFGGRFSVLVGPANQSGATITLAFLRAYRPNTRLIGEATGGSAEGPTAGVILFLKLPGSGITVRIPGIRSRLGVPFVPGMGQEPDLIVRETVADWIAGRDAVLEAARAN